MPEFRLRVWAEQTLYDARDYIVTAETLDEAKALLEELQERAEEADAGEVECPAVVADRPLTVMEGGVARVLVNYVTTLDPQDVTGGDGGIVELDATGDRVAAPGPTDAELLAEARAILADLLLWDDAHGCWRAPAWRRARAFAARMRGENPDEAVPLPAQLVGRLWRVVKHDGDGAICEPVETATEAADWWNCYGAHSLIEAQSAAAASELQHAYTFGGVGSRIEMRGWPDGGPHHEAEFQYLAWADAPSDADA